jgi:branched-subunit amino acid transport protein
MLTVLRTYFPERLRPAVAASLLLVPSVVYWTSGLIKEGIAVGGLGFALLGAHRVMERRLGGIFALVFGAAMILTIKPYLLMPFGVGMAALLYSHRSRGADGLVRIRPLWLAGAAVVAVVGVLLVGRLFPQFSVDTLGEQAAQMQSYGRKALGGSFYTLGDPNERSLGGQLQFAPLALFTALYRPLIIESNNAQALVNSLETTALLAITVLLFVQRGWRTMLATILSNPALAYSIAFTLPLALGVGLVSNNLGTLSRYRCPMVPYFVLALVTLYQARGQELLMRAQKAVAAPAPAALPRAPVLLPPSQRPRPLHRRPA